MGQRHQQDERAWAGFCRTFSMAAICLLVGLAGFVLVMNPFGNLSSPVFARHVIMDDNQRFQFPALVRSGAFDSFVIGTSTSRLLDPRDLEKAFGGRFANLAMNDARAWEQIQLLDLIDRQNRPLRTILLGLDAPWCRADADRNRITRRGFPEWMFDDNFWNDLPNMFNLKTVEISGRLAAHRLGLNEPRIPAHGFEIFTPPEGEYDAAKARQKIWGTRARRRTPVAPPFVANEKFRSETKLPALAWLADWLSRRDQATRVWLVFMPVHVAAQPRTGSKAAAAEAVCKQEIRVLAHRSGAYLVDFRITSPLTERDENYWDPLHYRLPIGRDIIADLASIQRDGKRASGVRLRLLADPTSD